MPTRNHDDGARTRNARGFFTRPEEFRIAPGSNENRVRRIEPESGEPAPVKRALASRFMVFLHENDARRIVAGGAYGETERKSRRRPEMAPVVCAHFMKDRARGDDAGPQKDPVHARRRRSAWFNRVNCGAQTRERPRAGSVLSHLRLSVSAKSRSLREDLPPGR